MVYINLNQLLSITLIGLLTVFLYGDSNAQSIAEQLDKKKNERQHLVKQLEVVEDELIDLKMAKSIEDLKALGLPSDNYTEHSAMILEYDENHEQAKWVAHMILPEIQTGKVKRTNDFREDPNIVSGTTKKLDYFETDTLRNGDVKYYSYGFDRGHLAPAADFRWSLKAVSESFFYSNMSPQLPDFNQDVWLELENLLRTYVIKNNVPLYVVTLPLLNKELSVIEESINKVSIPEQFAKVAYDPINKQGIGFVLNNRKVEKALRKFAMSINGVEAITGFNFFSAIGEKYESSVDTDLWFNKQAAGDVEPLDQPSLPPGHFNTEVVARHIGHKVCVCGKVVKTSYSGKGNLWLNLDKSYPNNTFSVFIGKKQLRNFDKDIAKLYTNQLVCVDGKVKSLSGNPTISLEHNKSIKVYHSKD